MRILLLLCICVHFAACNALAQENAPGQQFAPPSVPSPSGPQRAAPQQTSPQQSGLQPSVPQPTAPQSDPFSDDPDPLPLDNLDLDSNQSFDFNNSANSQFANPSDFQSSVASNSDFQGATPQMIGDFGGGSTIYSLGSGGYRYLTVPIPLAGGSRRIKIAENNQACPLDRIYATFNYFHNSNVAIGAYDELGSDITVVDSESMAQYTIGFEKTFVDNMFSIDVRMPFTSGISQGLVNDNGLSGSAARATAAGFETGNLGNLSTALKVSLLRVKETSISGGLGISLPTGSDVLGAAARLDPSGDGFATAMIIENNAVHLMPFLGAHRPFGDSSWVQAFAQIDVPTGGNDVIGAIQELDIAGTRVGPVGQFHDSLREQTLLYADVSVGKWWYRDISECGHPRCRQRGLTGIASILELHYTSALNDADLLAAAGSPGVENRFDVLNLTTGLIFELNEELRINLAGVFPLKGDRYDAGGRTENRFFDSELSVQINYLF